MGPNFGVESNGDKRGLEGFFFFFGWDDENDKRGKSPSTFENTSIYNLITCKNACNSFVKSQHLMFH